ncbi:hypothetical protein NB311A_08687 [Nitrobacter sp. Nb-311A]|nr:hypothetical protein NB311A_08687 [Nitrobacter sp. Nb-311A]
MVVALSAQLTIRARYEARRRQPPQPLRAALRKEEVLLPSHARADAPDLRRPATKVPVAGKAASSDNDAVDRAITSLNKRIEATEADPAAVGQVRRRLLGIRMIGRRSNSIASATVAGSSEANEFAAYTLVPV